MSLNSARHLSLNHLSGALPVGIKWHPGRFLIHHSPLFIKKKYVLFMLTSKKAREGVKAEKLNGTINYLS